MDTKQRLRLPSQLSGHHDELEELAAILSAEASARRTRTIDLTDPHNGTATILPRRPTHRGWRVAGGVVLALGAVTVALLASAVLRSTKPSPAPAHAPIVASASTAPNSPAAMGAAARHRLAAGGRPVSVFGCLSAYEIDAPGSSGMLPIAYEGTPEYAAYMSACVSDMSGQAVTPTGVAR